MATEQTIVGLDKKTIALIAVILTVIVLLGVYKNYGSTEAEASAGIISGVSSNTYRNDLQDKLIAVNAKSAKENKASIHKTDILNATLLEKASSTQSDVSELKTYLMQYDFKGKINEQKNSK